MTEKIELVLNEFNEKLNGVNSSQDVETLRVEFMGKKGKVTDLMSGLRDVPNEQKREMGMRLNELKNTISEKLEAKIQEIKDAETLKEIEAMEEIDYTLPTDTRVGSLHPRTILQKQVEDTFVSMGFIIEDGNEVETEYNNFDAVNVPATHPARDAQDTFWLDNGEVLKTQTSAAQNRILRTYGPKCRVLFPGRCFRNEALDASHENTFFQIEGVVVDENVSVSNLI